MIGGIGTDIVGMDRVRQLLKTKHKNRFLHRILTLNESKLTEKMGEERLLAYAAGRFAAKEAVVKALGCGIGEIAGFQDIEILPGDSPRPLCRLSDRTRQRLALGESDVVHISISHCETHAIAYAVWETRRA